MEVPAEVSEAFEAAIKALSGGEDLVIGTKDSFVTTQEAADFLGVSRPTMIRILDLGEVPYERPNSHRRIRLVDLVKFKAEHEKRRAALDDLLESSAKLDQFDGGFVKTR
ncbi:MAG: helix-turn-helix domain-containing protein [Propionibacteriaceae bacterium]|nr:helix-turn-helix domain-containing protein [Propionibacteriaceae bacterium]